MPRRPSSCRQNSHLELLANSCQWRNISSASAKSSSCYSSVSEWTKHSFHIHERAPAQRARRIGDPAVDRG